MRAHWEHALLMTRRNLTSPDRLMPAMRAGIGGICGLSKGKGSSEDAPKMSC